MQYAVSLSETNMPQDKVDEYLQRQLIEYIGGLSQFYGKRIMFDFLYTKDAEVSQYIGERNIHILRADVTEVNMTQRFEIKPMPKLCYEPARSRWYRFKQFVKGE